MRSSRFVFGFLCVALTLGLLAGCASIMQEGGERHTARDKTKKGAAIGAASGAVLGAVVGEGELDEVLAGAAIGAGIGAGVGHYMDRQEEKLAQIPGTSVERLNDDTLLVHFDSDVLFQSGSANLTDISRSTLDQAASVFNEFPKTAIIAQGHTDSVGSEEYNQQLSERRAGSVRSYLVARGVDDGRIVSLGYGESQPVDSNDTEYGRSKNRRVDLLLKAKAK
jgi:outer membrane protein OmpA-like peptidoglycan-associated protein